MDRLAELILEDAKAICERVDFKQLRGKRLLMTGSSGLVGTYFLACLNILRKEKGWDFSVHNIMTSEPSEHFKIIAGFKNSILMRGDLTDINFCRSLPESDFIIHAAGYGQPGKFLEDPLKTIRLNTVTLFELFEKLVKNGKLLFLSTSEVYVGLPCPPAYKETDIGATNTNHPRSCYIEGKRCGEAICNAYRARGVQAKSARLSLAYGPGTKAGDKRVINEFIRKGLKGEISLLDQGLAKRTYCYVADAVETMWNILFQGKDAVYNVGGCSKTTIGDLARFIGDYLQAKVIFPAGPCDGLAGAPDDVFLDMSKAEKEFDKKEYVDLTRGLSKTIEWQRLLYAVK